MTERIDPAAAEIMAGRSGKDTLRTDSGDDLCCDVTVLRKKPEGPDGET